jgi:aspartyl-tRNA(Asn)/glutamyl-tRNA(Gln) amidotransferase subunit A
MSETLTNWSTLFIHSQEKKRYMEYVASWEEKIHSFLQFDVNKGLALTDDLIRQPGIIETTDEFTGVPFGVKDNIAVRSFKLTCGSNMLESFVSPYTATAVERLVRRGAIVAGKTNLDEFGMGSSTENSALSPTHNPWDTTRVTGGSSGGSAAAVAAGLVPFALGTDTGGSVRQPASFCGVYGLKPTYGSVSRYGLVAYASSLEVIGVIAREIEIVQAVFETIRGIDPLDHSTNEYKQSGPREIKTIGIPAEKLDLKPEIRAGYENCVATFEKMGCGVREVEIPTLQYVVPAYYTIATAEASANLARYNGIRYGLRAENCRGPEELVRSTRDAGFGDEVKMRILLGTYVLRSGFQDQYYVKAQKIRTAIRNDIDRIFRDVDLLLMPTFPTAAFKHGSSEMDPFQQKLADKFTGTANLAGIPALSFPVGIENGVPVGMQLMAPAFGEKMLFDAAGRYAEEYPVPECPGYRREWS